MAGVFYKYQPTEYVPQYIPMDLENFAKAAQGMQERYDTNIALKDATEIMASNLQVAKNDQWIADDVSKGVNSDINDILTNNRVMDSGYLLNDVLKNRILTNKDLLWAQKQNAKIQQAEQMRLELGSSALDFNPYDTFSSVTTNEDGTKTYNDFSLDIEKQKDYGAKATTYFDQMEKEGFSSTVTTDPYWLQQISGSGITSKRIINRAAQAEKLYRSTEEYRQQKKMLMSPYYGNMNEEQADKYIKDFILQTGMEFENYSSSSQLSPNPYMKEMVKAQMKKDGNDQGFGTGNTMTTTEGPKAGLTSTRAVTPFGENIEKVILGNDGTIKLRRKVSDLSFKEKVTTAIDPFKDASIITLNKDQTKMFNFVKDKLSKQTGLTGDDLLQETVNYFNDQNKSGRQPVTYTPFPDRSTDLVNYEKQFVINDEDENKGVSFTNMGNLYFNDPTSETGVSKGSDFFGQHFGTGKNDRKGQVPDNIKNIYLVGQVSPGNTKSRLPFNGAYVWNVNYEEGGKTRSQLVYSQLGENYDANPVANVGAGFNILSDSKTYVAPYNSGASGLTDGSGNPITGMVYKDNPGQYRLVLDNGKTLIGRTGKDYTNPGDHLSAQLIQMYSPWDY